MAVHQSFPLLILRHCTFGRIETAEKSLYKQYWVLPAVPDFLKNPSFLFLSLYQVIFTSFFKVVLPLFSPILTV